MPSAPVPVSAYLLPLASALRTGSCALAVLALLVRGHALSAAGPLQLVDPNLRAPGEVRFSVAGPSEVRFSVDKSADLRLWLPVTNGTLAAMPAPVAVPLRDLGPHRFFRARQLLTEPKLKLAPDAERVAEAYVGAGSGPIDLELATPDGIEYVLHIPQGAVLEPVDLSMTLLSKAENVPFEGGMMAGLLFKPAGLFFYNPPLLEITFPMNIPSREIVSYQFQDDGSGLFLVPNLVDTNRVVIPVRHFSGTGVSRATLQQIAIREYFEVRDATDAVGQQIAAEFARERVSQLSGIPNEGATGSSALLLQAAGIVQREIELRLREAEGNCALAGRVLLPQALGMERQLQLLGADEAGSISSGTLFQGALATCREEALRRCASGERLCGLRELLGLERQRQLVGIGESDGEDFNQILAQCRPAELEWSGALSYLETGEARTSTGTGFVEETFHLSASALVNAVSGGGVLPFAVLAFCGDGEGMQRRVRKQTETINCVDGSKTGELLEISEEKAFGDISFSAVVTESNGQTRVAIDGDELIGVGRDLVQKKVVRCGAGPESSSSRTLREATFTFLGASGDSLSGVYQGKSRRGNVDTDVKIGWSLTKGN